METLRVVAKLGIVMLFGWVLLFLALETIWQRRALARVKNH